MKEPHLYKSLPKKKTQCQTCAHFCVLSPEETGKCGVRKNIKGKLYSLNYKKAAALNLDPIEKKPLFHFLPGSVSLSLGAAGCSLSCKNCQNWDLSQGPKITGRVEGKEISPEEIVKVAKEQKIPSISYTYTDPAAFLEYALDTMKIAKKEGIKNCFVTHGFFSEEALKEVLPLLDAANIDIKSFSDDFYKENCSARLEPVLKTAKEMKKAGVWVEITTLVIPTLSDSKKTFEDIAKFIHDKLGPETPWHVSRFSGHISYKLQHLPETPEYTLETAYKIGKKKKLKYVYTGNLYGHPMENTYCPKCKTLCIDRTGYVTTRYDIKGKCPKCKENLNLILK